MEPEAHLFENDKPIVELASASAVDAGIVDASGHEASTADAYVMVTLPPHDGGVGKAQLLAAPAIPAKTYPPPDGAEGLVPCGGFFPADADADEAEVLASVTVESSGAPSAVDIVTIQPPELAFGASARACLLLALFRPAMDPDGKPVRARASVRVRFAR